ncbi:O-antigen ligase family protein [Mesorhizobium sp.]|uniref:O-antigen ligase family protein n=1 Tax=Mesorhizobium sp. TaxID=1871066 RepID=UPI00257E9F7C|nr:O-antigen ligase family protein [Mesorhizobium sp.]
MAITHLLLQNPSGLSALLLTKPLPAMIGYLAWMGFVTVLSGSAIGERMIEWGMLAVYLSVGVIVFLLLRTRPSLMHGMLRGIDALGLLVLGTFAFSLFFDVRDEMNTGISRIFGVYGDSAAWTASFFFVLAFARKQWAIFAAFGIFLGLSGSMGGTIAAVSGVLCFLALLVFRGRLKPMYLVLPVLLGCAGLWLLQGYGSIPLFDRLLNEEVRNFSMNARYGAYWTALRISYEFPFFGTGFGGFADTALEQSGLDQLFPLGFSAVYISNAQNQYFQALAEGGIIGLGFYVAMLLTTIRWLFRLESAEPDPVVRQFLGGSFSWLTAMAITNQTAVWVMPHSLNAIVLSLIIGISAARLIHRNNFLRYIAHQRIAVGRASFPYRSNPRA